MDQKDDGVLRLLQDIKEMLFGIALILLGGIMVTTKSNGIISLFDAIILLGGICLLLYGAYHVWNGKNHELGEKNGEPQNKEQQGGSHAL